MCLKKCGRQGSQKAVGEIQKHGRRRQWNMVDDCLVARGTEKYVVKGQTTESFGKRYCSELVHYCQQAFEIGATHVTI